MDKMGLVKIVMLVSNIGQPRGVGIALEDGLEADDAGIGFRIKS